MLKSEWDKTSFGDSSKHYHEQLGVSRFISLQESKHTSIFSHFISLFLCPWTPYVDMVANEAEKCMKKYYIMWLFCIKKSPFAYVKPVTVKLIQLQLFYLYTQRCTIIYVFNKLINGVYFWCFSLRRWGWSILHRGHMRLLSWWRQDPCGPRHGFHLDLYPN